ncbi:MAG: nucleotide exchange factor GrpE [Alicyclobacillus sp.]|nr:nucleotide exchange factor GrpE [Alicyclobacillus sp.]
MTDKTHESDTERIVAQEGEVCETANAAEQSVEEQTGEALEATNEEPGSEDGGAEEEAARFQAEIADLQQQLLRIRADFDNFRKRTRQEREELQQFATKRLLTDLLPVVDNFDRALAAMPEDEAMRDMRTGIEMVHRQLLGVLEQQGVTRMDVIGQPFDPNLHEAVMQEPADGRTPGVVVRELQTGYILHGKVLRPAMVAVTV